MPTRAEILRTKSPHLIVDLTLYPTENGGGKSEALPGWGCLCCDSNVEPIVRYVGWPLLGDEPMAPGQQRRLGFVFLSGDEAAKIFKQAGKFYLWEGRFIGEAVVVDV